MKPSICLLIAATLLGDAVSARSEEQPKVIMHRQDVTAKNETGWYLAKSTEGRYTVLMPLPFSDFTIAAKKMDGRDLKMHGISGRTSDGVKFSVLSVSWDSPKPDLNSLYENFRKPGQTVTKPTFSEFNATLSQTFEVIREKSGAFIRHVLSPTELFSFVAEFPAGTKETIEPLARSFFDSLQPGQPTKMPEPSRP